MKNNYIPEIFKEKIYLSLKYIYAFSLLFLSILSLLSLLTFDINDNSFLTSTSNEAQNFMGDLGSYYASFIFYTFGVLGYLVALFFLIYSILILLNRSPKYIFIRLSLFFISLVLIPQSLIYLDFNFIFIESIETWGIFANYLYNFYNFEYISYALSIFGLSIYLLSQNILTIFRFPKISFGKIFKKNVLDDRLNTKIKKDPFINNINTDSSQEINDLNEENENIKSKKKSEYLSPSLEILDSNNALAKKKLDKENIKANSDLLERVFQDFNIEIQVINVKHGPVVTLFEILPAAGIKINTIINLADDISRSMGVGAVRIAQIYGTQYLGVEVPNDQRETVTIKELLINENFKNTSSKIPICIGKDISGNIEVIDLSKTPHLLVAGTTGSGKSVFINTLLASILYKFSPEDLRLILIDPKMLELSVYNDIAHLLTPVVTEPKKAIIALKWVCKEMERRYSLMNEENTRNLEGYNQKSIEKLPFIVVFIDEMADLMMTAGKEVEHYVQRLAQMARACGIHLVMATQRPSVDIITGSIKANFPSRISFQVASKYDSRTVLGEIGAEQLLGNGDMLMSKNGGNIIRYQSAFISDNEVNKLIKEIKRSQKVQYLDELDQIIKNNDENFDSLSDEDEALITKSIDLIKSTNKASTSFLQRNFQVGYNKAARIMEALEHRGVVSAPNHAGKRDILINN
ncbi:DNA translocase FtsK 4TM domain-containing protein [Alphaproteobacteria bacterium]|nr:DNA translocase FtsK 4TM domain-containing protein [Alphaproteobacteria bacterium]